MNKWYKRIILLLIIIIVVLLGFKTYEYFTNEHISTNEVTCDKLQEYNITLHNEPIKCKDYKVGPFTKGIEVELDEDMQFIVSDDYTDIYYNLRNPKEALKQSEEVIVDDNTITIKYLIHENIDDTQKKTYDIFSYYYAKKEDTYISGKGLYVLNIEKNGIEKYKQQIKETIIKQLIA